MSPSRRGVRYKAAARTMKEPFGLARECIDGILRQGAVGHQRLTEQDCDRIAQIQVLLTSLKKLLPPTEDTKDDRLERCWDSCEQAAAVLQDRGWAEQLRNAREAHAKALNDFTSEAGSPAHLPVEHSSPAQFSGRFFQPVLDRTSSHGRASLLELIDDAESAETALVPMQELFQVYLADDMGFLEGPGLDLALRDMTKHVQREWKARNKRLQDEGKLSMGDLKDEVVKDWVLKAIDTDGDGCISYEEATRGFKKVVAEID